MKGERGEEGRGRQGKGRKEKRREGMGGKGMRSFCQQPIIFQFAEF